MHSEDINVWLKQYYNAWTRIMLSSWHQKSKMVKLIKVDIVNVIEYMVEYFQFIICFKIPGWKGWATELIFSTRSRIMNVWSKVNGVTFSYDVQTTIDVYCKSYCTLPFKTNKNTENCATTCLGGDKRMYSPR